ncbi:hypothetical protein DPX16_15688 [Anabarilius grahami]|uniref:Uncharacterized protein n=1 Tax=Anabarilius grahami TaxID=495550 RepID=A0A3N0YT44_ANAGA|nr:hypothetical protein DPX16_15688 [Anabarilius grahami]
MEIAYVTIATIECVNALFIAEPAPKRDYTALPLLAAPPARAKYIRIIGDVKLSLALIPGGAGTREPYPSPGADGSFQPDRSDADVRALSEAELRAS